MQLISQELIEKYVEKEIISVGGVHKTVFRYTGKKVEDCDEVEIGFTYPSGEQSLQKILLPSVRDDGLLQRNRTLWYRIYMVIPPLAFFAPGQENKPRFMDGIINTSSSASKLIDFFPAIRPVRRLYPSRLEKELSTRFPVDVNNTRNWLAISMEIAILELFNRKIAQDIGRSSRPGYQGISAARRGVHSLIAAFSRFYGPDEDEYKADMLSSDSEETLLGPIHSEDKKGILILHPYMKKTAIYPDTPIDFCTCSSSRPIVTARLKDGVHVDHCRFEGQPTFLYTGWRRAIVGVLNDDPHRVIVSRAITRSLHLERPSVPYVQTETVLGVDSLSLPGVRITHPLTFEDGIVVSETFARRAGAYKVYVDEIRCPENTSVTLVRKPVEGDPRTLAFQAARKDSEIATRPGDMIAVLCYTGMKGETVVKEVRSQIKAPGVLVSVDRFPLAHDLEENWIVNRLAYMVYLPLSVGDKLSDGHGNKGTVSDIWPDERMPVWIGNGRRIETHYLANPYIMKRMAVGAEIEDKLALIGFHASLDTGENEYVSLQSDLPYALSEADEDLREHELCYEGELRMDGTVFDNVPLSVRRMFRLDNNAVETCQIHKAVEIENGHRSPGARFGLDMVTLISRKANLLAHHLIEMSRSKEMLRENVIPSLLVLSDVAPRNAQVFDITERLPREILGNPSSHVLLSQHCFENTACDPRIRTMYGRMKTPKGYLLVPPHEPFVDLGNGSFRADEISVAANRVVAECISCDSYGSRKTDVERTVSLYRKLIAGRLTGKRGLLRNVLYPIVPYTLRAVFSSHPGDDIHQIMIPRNQFQRLMKDPAFRERYSTGADLCLLKRDPVHRSNNLVAVRFGLWDHPTIGIHPLLVQLLDGDLDGDTGTVVFITNFSAYSDLRKLHMDFDKHFRGSKQISEASSHNALALLRKNVGWVSTFNHPHPSDQSSNPRILDLLCDPVSTMETTSLINLNSEAIRAARDFEIIKDGTAQTGAMGLSLVFSCPAGDESLLERAMELYHIIAQNTLNAKAGSKVPGLDLAWACRNGTVDNLRPLLEALDAEHLDIEEYLREYTSKIQQFGSRTEFQTSEFPLLAATQSSTPEGIAEQISSRYVRKQPMGSGFWEVMFDYLAGRSEKTPFDWSGVSLGMLVQAMTGRDVSDEKTLEIGE